MGLRKGLLMLFVVMTTADDYGKDYKKDLSAEKTAMHDLEDSVAQLVGLFNQVQHFDSAISTLAKTIALTLSDRLAFSNQDQLAVVNMLKEQAQEAKDHANHLNQHAEEAKDLAEAVASDMPALSGGMDEVMNAQDALTNGFNGLQGELDALDDDVENDLMTAVTNELAATNALTDRLDRLLNLTQSRGCKSGVLRLSVPSTVSYSFGAPFSQTPSVTYSIMGSRSSLLDPASSTVDSLGFSVTLTDVTDTQATFSVTRVADSSVEIKDVFILVMTCQNLDLVV